MKRKDQNAQAVSARQDRLKKKSQISGYLRIVIRRVGFL